MVFGAVGIFRCRSDGTFVRNDLLETHPLLSFLPKPVLDKLIASSPVVAYRKGAKLFQEGEPCSSLYRILSGRCESCRTMPDGSLRRIEILGPGDFVGDVDLLGQGNHHSSVRVITDSVLQQIQNCDLRSLLDEKSAGARTENGNGPVEVDEPVPHCGQVIAAVSVSDRLPGHLIVETLAQSLFAETGESVLLLQLVPAHRASASVSVNLNDVVDSDFHFHACLPKANGSVARLSLKVGPGGRSAENVAPLLSILSRHFHYVMVDADMTDTPVAPLIEFIIQADASYLFVHPNPDDVRVFNTFMDDVRSQASGNCSDINPVVCVREGERATDNLKLNNGYPHSYVHDTPMPGGSRDDRPAFARDLRSLAREVGRCRIGLALSAGGAKGLAHIGVLQVLEENGIEVDVIAGCSMGAYVASVWAVGCDGQVMEKLAREVEGRWGLWKLLDPAIPPRQGFLRGEAVIKRLKNTIGDAHFSDLVRPLRIVATDLNTLDRVIFSSGEVAKAVHASCAIPGVCVPVAIDGEIYIDGGVADPLPVDILTDMGIDRIIAVNALPPTSLLRCRREQEKEQTDLLHKQPDALKIVNRQVNYFAAGNILDIMMNAVHGAQIRVAEQACRHANVVLRPLGFDAHWHDFNHPGKYITMGRQVALKQLAELKALVRKKVSHEHTAAHERMAELA
jgi:NTE family protein